MHCFSNEIRRFETLKTVEFFAAEKIVPFFSPSLHFCNSNMDALFCNLHAKMQRILLIVWEKFLQQIAAH